MAFWEFILIFERERVRGGVGKDFTYGFVRCPYVFLHKSDYVPAHMHACVNV